MADSNEMVTVTLDQPRIYRAKHDDTTAITVGPGEVQVPAWVAEGWLGKAPAVASLPNDERAAYEAKIAALQDEVSRLQAEFATNNDAGSEAFVKQLNAAIDASAPATPTAPKPVGKERK